VTLAYPGQGTSSLCEQIAKDYFIASLSDRDLELKIREREPRDLESAFKHAVRLEATVATTTRVKTIATDKMMDSLVK